MKKIFLSLIGLSSLLYVGVGLADWTDGGWYADRGAWSSPSKTIVPSDEFGLARLTAASAAYSTSAAFVIYPGTGIFHP